MAEYIEEEEYLWASYTNKLSIIKMKLNINKVVKSRELTQFTMPKGELEVVMKIKCTSPPCWLNSPGVLFT